MKLVLGPCLLALAAVMPASRALAAADQPPGAKLYKQQACVMCHGEDGKGFPAIQTPDFTDPKWQVAHSDQEITNVIKNGSKKNSLMKGFGDKLNDSEIVALVKYIRSFGNGQKK